MRDGWLSWPWWLTDSGRLNRKVITHPASSLAQDRESSPAETSILTTYATPPTVNVLIKTFLHLWGQHNDVLNSQHAGTGATWRINTKILSTCSPGRGKLCQPPAQLVHILKTRLNKLFQHIDSTLTLSNGKSIQCTS